jgi:hypothetical protein
MDNRYKCKAMFMSLDSALDILRSSGAGIVGTATGLSGVFASSNSADPALLTDPAPRIALVPRVDNFNPYSVRWEPLANEHRLHMSPKFAAAAGVKNPPLSAVPRDVGIQFRRSLQNISRELRCGPRTPPRLKHYMFVLQRA